MIDAMREMFSWLASTDSDLLVVLSAIALLAGCLWLARCVALLIAAAVVVAVSLFMR